MSLHQSLNEKSESFVMLQEEENQLWPATERAGGFAERQPPVPGSMHRPIINVFIVYESDLNRDRAQFMREELSRRVGQSFAIEVSWRSLKSLGRHEIRNAAASSVAEADIICFSLLSGGELPERVTTWLEKGILSRKTSKLCLLALVETGGMMAPHLSRAEVYLSQLSLAAGVDCLCYSDSIPIARSVRSKRQERQPAKRTTPANRVPYSDALGDQDLPISPFLFSSRRRLAQPIGRGNLKP